MIGIRVVCGFVRQAMRRDGRLALTHRAPFLFDVISLLAGAAVFYFLGRYAAERGGRPALFAFAVAGLAVLRLNASMNRIVPTLSTGLASGTLELLLNSPRSCATVLLGESAFELLRGAAGAGLTILAAVVVFGAPTTITVSGVLAIISGLMIAVVLFWGLAAFTAAALLIVRQAGALTTFGSLVMPLLAGAYFPVSRLPQPLAAISLVLPFRAAVELIRDGLLQGRFAAGAALALCAGTVGFVGAAVWSLDRAVRYARRATTLGYL